MLDCQLCASACSDCLCKVNTPVCLYYYCWLSCNIILIVPVDTESVIICRDDDEYHNYIKNHLFSMKIEEIVTLVVNAEGILCTEMKAKLFYIVLWREKERCKNTIRTYVYSKNGVNTQYIYLLTKVVCAIFHCAITFAVFLRFFWDTYVFFMNCYIQRCQFGYYVNWGWSVIRIQWPTLLHQFIARH